MRITNNTNIPLALAVWLVHDEYDYVNEENYISVTGLMKPLRHIILPSRVPKEEQEYDVADFTARALGHSIHDSIEKAWKKGYKLNLRKLGIPQDVVDIVKINPTDEEVIQLRNQKEEFIPIYLEQRAITEYGGYKIGGKFDLVAEGIVQDTKSTSVNTVLFGSRDDEHILQGSLYRWIDSFQPVKKITEDHMQINYVFTDWNKFLARTNPKYPATKTISKKLNLMPLRETELWVRDKLALITKYKDTPEKDLPFCTDEELWRSLPSYKYYADPAKTDGRSTKNFDTYDDATKFMINEKGGKGIVITKPGEVKRCGYCNAFPVCTQKDQYQ